MNPISTSQVNVYFKAMFILSEEKNAEMISKESVLPYMKHRIWQLCIFIEAENSGQNEWDLKCIRGGSFGDKGSAGGDGGLEDWSIFSAISSKFLVVVSRLLK